MPEDRVELKELITDQFFVLGVIEPKGLEPRGAEALHRVHELVKEKIDRAPDRTTFEIVMAPRRFHPCRLAHQVMQHVLEGDGLGVPAHHMEEASAIAMKVRDGHMILIPVTGGLNAEIRHAREADHQRGQAYLAFGLVTTASVAAPADPEQW